MIGLSAKLNYYQFNGNLDLRKGIFRLWESIRKEMSHAPERYVQNLYGKDCNKKTLLPYFYKSECQN